MARSPQRSVLFLALLCLSAPLAAAPHWAPLGPYGGWVYGLAVDPSDARIVYASMLRDWHMGLSKSTDGGAHWTTILDSGGQVVVDPAQHDTLYKADGHLLKSVDGGTSWAEIGPGSGPSRPYIGTVSVDPTQPSRVYASGPTGVWRSANRGASWKRASLSTGGGVVAVRPAGTVFVVGEGGVHKSTDGGLTWKTLPLPNGVTSVWPFAVAPSDPRWIYAASNSSGLFRSMDGGKTWQATGRQPEAGDAVTVLSVSSRSPRSLWLVTPHRGLYHSTDGGDTWKATGPSPVRRHVQTVVVAPSSPDTVYAGVRWGIWTNGGSDPGGVFASGDDGKTWVRSNQGLTGLEATAMAVDPQDPAVLWVSNRIGLFRSTNGGLDWTQTQAGGNQADRIIIDSTATSRVFVLMGWSFLRTLDGGESWSILYGPNGRRPSCAPCGPGEAPLGGMSYMGLGPEQPPKLWAGTDEGEIFNSSDQGAHWNRVKLPQAPCYISDLDFAPSSPNILYAAGVQTQCDYIGYAAFFRSADGGATWKNAGAADLRGHPFQEGHRIAIDPVDPRLIYLATSNVYTDAGDGVWKSTDGGSTWVQAGNKLRGQPITDVVASPVAGVVWASTYPISLLDRSRIFRSGDGGATWQERKAGLDFGLVYQLAIDPVDPRRIYAAGSGGVWAWTQ